VSELKLGVAFSLQLDESRYVSGLSVYTPLVQKPIERKPLCGADITSVILSVR